MSSKDESMHGDAGIEIIEKSVRNRAPSIKVIENEIMEKSLKLSKLQKSIESQVNGLIKSDPNNVPDLIHQLEKTQQTCEKEVDEMVQFLKDTKSEARDKEAADTLTNSIEWLEISKNAIKEAKLEMDEVIVRSLPTQAPLSTQTTSVKSKRSHSSRSTSSTVRRLEANVQAAKEKARFEFNKKIRHLELERKLKEAESQRIQIIKETEIETLKAERELAIAEAAAMAYNQSDSSVVRQYLETKLEPQRDNMQTTQEWVDSTEEGLSLQQEDDVIDNTSAAIESSQSKPINHSDTFVLPTTRNTPSSTTQESPQQRTSTGFAGNNHLFRPDKPMEQYNQITSEQGTATQQYDFQSEMNHRLVSSLTKQSLPKCEPDIFLGDAALFLPWKVAFKLLIKDTDASPDQELTYLLQYTAGKPKELVNTFRRRVHPNATVKLDNFWKTMEERFGHNSEVTNALIENLIKTAHFKADDREALQKFYDTCEDVNSQIPYLKGLSILNSSYFMKSLVEKIPRVIKDKWESKVTKYMVDKQNEDYPPFSLFVDVIHNTSLSKNHPSIIKIQGLDHDRHPKEQKVYSSRHAVNPSRLIKPGYSKSLKTDVSPNKIKDGPDNSKSKESKSEQVNCPLHQEAASPHTLVVCRTFAGKTIDEKAQIIQEAGICFRCLVGRHFAKRCTADIKCTKCAGRHLSIMHKDTNTSTEKTDKGLSSQGGEAVGSACMKVCGNEVRGRSCGKTVLVDIFHEDQPSMVHRGYASIDDQSNHTLGDPELFDSLNINGEQQAYTLETCHGKEVCQGRRGQGLVIQALDGTTCKLPTVIESNNIPGDKTEIPTPDIIEHIPHLHQIARFIPPLDTAARIVLIIGRDAPELLKVRESINGPKGAPWAQRLDLGWTVSGEVCLERQGGRVHINTRKTSVGLEYNYEPCDNVIKYKEYIAPDAVIFNDRILSRKSTAKDLEQKILHQIEKDVFHSTKTDNEIGMSREDRLFINLMEQGFHKNEKGNWEAPLPFRNPDVFMPNNRKQAEKRFKGLLKKFARDSQLKADYIEFMTKIIERGHASPASKEKSKEGKSWFLPHFGVYHPKKKSQIRVVFDSSAEYAGTSLNSELLAGPDLMNRLQGRLHRFRQEEVAIMCDIEQMFHSFHVDKDHRNFLQFLWFKDSDPVLPVIDYHMNVHLFGNGPSPAIATFGLRKSADEGRIKYGESAHKFVHEEFYVDDGVYSCQTPEEAITLIKSAQKMLAESNLRLHKVVSNVPAVMEAIPQDDRAKGLKDIDFTNDKLPVQRSLGVQWDLDEDVFTFQAINRDKPYTRRGVLSIIHSLYDPFGFAAPYLIIGKKILQTLILLGKAKDIPLNWDDPLPTDLEIEWDTWNKDLEAVNNIKVKRCFKPTNFGKVTRIELHAFCDASQDAIGVVVYLRMFNYENQVWISFVKASAKVKPQKRVSIPRMELSAAVLLVNTVRDIKKDLEYQIDNTFYYTDSKVVLGYIMNESKRFFMYVANRVEIIRNQSSPTTWRYINTETNPADIATRGCSASKLTKGNWFTGPNFLWTPQKDIPFETFSLHDENDEELRPEVKVNKILGNTHDACALCAYFKCFEDWNKLCRSVALLKLFMKLRMQPPDNRVSYDTKLNPKIIKEAEDIIITHVQHRVFVKEISILKDKETDVSKKSPLKGLPLQDLDPFIHTDGLLRVGGRMRRAQWPLSEKHPAILPKSHHITSLLIRHYHEATHHQGRLITHGKIRQSGFWIIGGPRLVSSYIRNCFRCNFLRRPCETPKMADLPDDRLQSTAPFSYVGMDAFGPWEITTRKTRGGSACSKRWGLIFTCLNSRANHIETVESMDTSSFINALRRFIALRGPVTVLRSDQGTNFIGARAELTEALKEIKNDRIRQFLIQHECDWKFNPPHASHFGGIWERQIGTLRRVLDGMLLELGKAQLTHDLLITLMAEAAAIVNSRPITVVPTDVDEPQPLSPANILTMKTRPYLPPPGEFTRPDLYCRKQWRRVQYLSDQFWLRWRRGYIQNHQQRKKWKSSSPNIKVNDIVLIRDKNSIRGQWPKGRVTKIKVSEDGIVREAEISVYVDNHPGAPVLQGQQKTYSRPVCDLVVLFSGDKEDV